ncbi:EAL domain-containing protein [Thiotrichales bacterium 19S9-12]|nr:EAL domain-containing protein [Thiotrichales bacterium 19S9-11]MCF6810991.1 EAL domain-containing protein [Thiotrichales bacterium 19S9-12]
MEYKILVIDDTASIHEDFKQIFSYQSNHSELDELEKLIFDESNKKNEKALLSNICIDSAYSGEEGIKFVEKSNKNISPYSVAIVDIRMPGGIDGVETAEKILQIEPNIQIVFCSAYSDYNWEDMIEKLQHLDRWVILKKPFEMIEAQQIVYSLCEKWVLLLDMRKQIEMQTKALQEQIQQLNKAQDEIYDLAYYDSLTKLPNRLFFKELLKESLDLCKKNDQMLGVFFLDIDDFKQINDTFGHDVGDSLLIKIAQRINELFDSKSHQRIRSKIKNPTAICSRLGGDEFILLLKNVNDKNDITRFADLINQTISEEAFKVSKRSLVVTASIGVSIYPIDAKKAEDLLKNADIAMYQAKRQGKNQVVLHNRKLNNEVINKHLIIQDIYQGLAEEEFFLEYQPKLSIKDKKIVGCEALIRWQHPKKGILQPGSFIPIAEESDLIIAIDQYVLEKACQQIKEWQITPKLKNIRISINMSANFLNQDNMVGLITKEIKKHNISPNNLEIEITESKLVQCYEEMLKKLNSIKRLLGNNIKVSIDDFGTGYSSLSYLSELPVDIVKIDRSFVSKINNSEDNQIIKAIIKLSHALNFSVIAEGVESSEQYNFLKDERCDEMQGFLLSKSMKPHEFVKFVKNYKPS